MDTQTPAPQRCPGPHSGSLEHVQYPFVHRPVIGAHAPPSFGPPSLQLAGDPHCESLMHVPQVPCTHAWPPPHWLFCVHAPQAPFTHARPGAPTIIEPTA
jgi:hypothetical protein